MSEFVELGLRKVGSPASIPLSQDTAGSASQEAMGLRADLKGVIGRLIDILQGSTLEADVADATAFKTGLEDLNRQLLDAAHRQEVLLVATACLKLCKQHVQKARTYYAKREDELTQLIAILREAVESALGESSKTFGAEVLSSVDRFKRLGELDDLRTLRTGLAAEVGSLRELAAKKLEQDQQSLAALSERVMELEDTLRLAKEEASVDALTQIANRAAFNRSLKQLMTAAVKSGEPLALCMLDVNKFKSINDTYGHTVGDSLLRFTGKALADAFRPEDTVARYGGDEFAVLLPGTDASKVASRLGVVLAQLADRVYEYQDGQETIRLRFSVSAGVTQFWHGDTETEFIARADEGLYDSKKKPGSVVVKKRSRLAGIFGG